MMTRLPLDELAAPAEEAAVPAIAGEARELADRLGEGRSYVACVSIEVNSARVEGDLNDRVTESRRRLEAAVRAAVADVGRGASDALERARLAREAGQLAVAVEVDRIDRLLERLRAILPRAGQAA